MRLSADGQRLVYIAGYGEHPPRPMVTAVLEHGTVLPIAPGHHPAWWAPHQVAFCPQEDGKVLVTGGPGMLPAPVEMPAGNTLAAAASKIAVARNNPRRVILSSGRVILGAMDPAISDDGRWVAYVIADQDATGAKRDGVSTLYVDTWEGAPAPRAMWEGAPTRPRFGGTTLAWEIGRGLIAAGADVSNPALPATSFALPGVWKLSHPVPVWVPTRGELLILFVADGGDVGHLFMASWTSLKQGEPRGYALGTSTGSAFDHDARPVFGQLDDVAVVWLDPAGLLERRTQKLTATRVVLTAPVPPPPPPPPQVDDDGFDFVPTGTLVQDAIATLIGRNPVREGDVICLHKNTFPECEWRRLAGDQLLHWADASRVPGDPGWWIEPAPVWCLDTFRSGAAVSTEGARIVDLRPGVPPNRWRQTNTLYGLKGGGVCVQFDPRFAGQYTDMSKQGTPQWAPAGYERQWTLRDGRSKWQYIVTPLAAKGVIPWGDRSLDVVIQEVVSGPQPPSTPLPFVPCPRPLEGAPKPEPKPMPSATTDQIAAFIGELNDPILLGARQRYRDEVLLPRDRVSAATDGDGHQANHTDMMTGGAAMFFDRSYVRDYLIARVKGQDVMGASVAGLIGAADAYRRAVGIANPQ